MKKRKYSILFLCRSIGPHQEKIIDQITKEFHDLTVLCSSENIGDSYHKYLHPHFQKVADLCFRNWMLIFIAPILVFLDSVLYKRDKVIGHYTVTFGWASAFAFRSKRIIIAMGSDLLFDPFKNYLKRLAVIFALRRSHLLLYDNKRSYQNAQEFGFRGEAIFSPFGVVVPKKQYDIEDKLEKYGETILWARGADNPIYNFESFLEALTILKQKGCKENWKAYILGKATKTSKIMEYLKENKLQKNVTVFGYTRNKELITKLYRESTIYVSSSLSDGTSVALLEAMVSGMTLVVSNIPNNAFWVQNNESGFLFDPNNPNEVASILKEIIDGEISVKNRKKFSKNNFDVVKDKGSIEIFRKQLSRFLNS